MLHCCLVNEHLELPVVEVFSGNHVQRVKSKVWCDFGVSGTAITYLYQIEMKLNVLTPVVGMR